MGAQGTAILDFGAFPGKSDTSVAVTGQAAIVAGSLVEAWIRPVATADHTADEHLLETIRVMAGNIAAGVGFTIYGVNASQINEPLMPPGGNPLRAVAGLAEGIKAPSIGGKGTHLYGLWTVAWVWN